MADSSFRGVWREGEYLIAQHGVAQFPSKCIICGSEDNSQALTCKVRKRPRTVPFLWAQQLFGLQVLFGLSVSIKPYFCAAHRKKELIRRRIGHAIITIAIAMFVIPMIFRMGDSESMVKYALLASGSLLFWGWIFYRIFRRRIIWAEGIKKRDAWIPDVDPSVLALIPELPAAAA
jgi:hypothetical protein